MKNRLCIKNEMVERMVKEGVTKCTVNSANSKKSSSVYTISESRKQVILTSLEKDIILKVFELNNIGKIDNTKKGIDEEPSVIYLYNEKEELITKKYRFKGEISRITKMYYDDKGRLICTRTKWVDENSYRMIDKIGYNDITNEGIYISNSTSIMFEFNEFNKATKADVNFIKDGGSIESYTNYFEYNKQGDLTSMKYGNGLNKTNEYNEKGLLIKSSNNDEIFDISYEY